MFKKQYLGSYLTWGITAAIAFIIPMIIFVSAGKYTSTWWLYVGNALFLVVIASYMLYFNKTKGENASTQTMIAAGHIATVIGIVLSCIAAAIALVIFVPDIFSSTKSDAVLTDAPAQTGTGKTNGLIFMIFMNAIIGNLCGGSFASIILPYTSRKNQTKDRRSEVLNN